MYMYLYVCMCVYECVVCSVFIYNFMPAVGGGKIIVTNKQVDIVLSMV